MFSAACGFVVNNDSFDATRWKNGNSRIKGKMVYDLQNSKILIGKSKTEVDDLLGRDDYPSENRKTFVIDTNIPTDIYFSIHFDKTTQKVKSTDIGD